eukprot:3749460-Amphidinium_carterae.1
MGNLLYLLMCWIFAESIGACYYACTRLFFLAAAFISENSFSWINPFQRYSSMGGSTKKCVESNQQFSTATARTAASRSEQDK